MKKLLGIVVLGLLLTEKDDFIVTYGYN